MSKELIKELELLREYNQKRYLEPRLKLLIDYIDELEEKVKVLEWDNNDKKGIENDYLNLKEKIDKAIEVLDEILVYDDFSDITKGFGNVKEELKFYLSECKTLEDFRKKNEILKDSDVDE